MEGELQTGGGKGRKTSLAVVEGAIRTGGPMRRCVTQTCRTTLRRGTMC